MFRLFSIITGGILLAASATAFAAGQNVPAPRSLDSLPPTVRALAESAVRYADSQWDEQGGLIGEAGGHGTRGSAQYAVGLMLRNGPGDAARARRIIASLARVQVDAPQSADHGIWPMRAEDRSKLPGRRSQPSLDPNWREFVGSAEILLLEDFGPLLDAPSTALLEQGIRRAAEGAHMRAVRPQYTNIALMSAHLMSYAGRRFDVAEWRDHGSRLAEAIYRNFKKNGSFDEYNSPTYGGVDLYGLGLWRTLPPTRKMARMGREMEEVFWRDIAAFYHAGMRNLCGPFDRAYGMDMQKYVALTGEWIAFCLPGQPAPIPAIGSHAPKEGEFFTVPSYALVRHEPPADILPKLQAFEGERLLRRPIGFGGRRVATAWLSKDLMIGGGFTPPFKDSLDQPHPATAHWVGPDGGICWLRLRGDFSVDATAAKNALAVQCVKAYGVKMGDSVRFEVHAPGARAADVEAGHWTLPGLDVRVSTALAAPTVKESAEGLDIRYPVGEGSGEARLELVITHTGEQAVRP